MQVHFACLARYVTKQHLAWNALNKLWNVNWSMRTLYVYVSHLLLLTVASQLLILL